MSIEHKLQQIVRRQQEISAILAAQPPVDNQTIAKLSKEYSDITPLVDIVTDYHKAKKELADAVTHKTRFTKPIQDKVNEIIKEEQPKAKTKKIVTEN